MMQTTTGSTRADTHPVRDRVLTAVTATIGLAAAGVSFVGLGYLIWW